MIVTIFTLISNWITSLATSFSAYNVKRKNNLKYKNLKKKLKTVLTLYIKEYREQIKVLESIFRVENSKNDLKKVNEINDLEIKSYIDDLILLTDNCINEYIDTADCDLNADEISKLLTFSSLLKNFFSVTNMIKERAHDVNSDNSIKIFKYKHELMSSVPNFLRSECGGLNADFSVFISELNNKIENNWKEIEMTLDSVEVKRRDNQ